MSDNDFVLLDNGDKAVHMVGDWVGIVAQVKKQKREVVVEGVTYTATVKIPDKSDLHIQFIGLRQDSTGEWYEDDDFGDYVCDWLGPKTALQMADELTKAVKYLEDNL